MTGLRIASIRGPHVSYCTCDPIPNASEPSGSHSPVEGGRSAGDPGPGWKRNDNRRMREGVSYTANYELTYTFNGKPLSYTARSNDPLLTSNDVVQARLALHSPGTRGLVYVRFWLMGTPCGEW